MFADLVNQETIAYILDGMVSELTLIVCFCLGYFLFRIDFLCQLFYRRETLESIEARKLGYVTEEIVEAESITTVQDECRVVEEKTEVEGPSSDEAEPSEVKPETAEEPVEVTPASPSSDHVSSETTEEDLPVQQNIEQPTHENVEESHTTVNYNELIEACARKGEMDKAAGLFVEMCTAQVEPSLDTYRSMFLGYCVAGKLERAMELFSLMRRKGVSPDATLFNALLEGCRKLGMRGLADAVLRDMEASGIACSNLTVATLVQLYGSCLELDRAFEVVEELTTKYGLKTNAHIYTCLISACAANDRFDRAMEVFEEMKTQGCAADATTIKILVQSCLMHGEVSRAAELLRTAPELAELAEKVRFMVDRRQLAVELETPVLAKLDKCSKVAMSNRASLSSARASGFLQLRASPIACH